MSKQIRWGILSTAKIGRTAVIPAIQQSERGQVIAIASRDESRAAEVAAELNIPKAYGSYDALLADEEIDAVYIPMPNHLHMEWTIRAARAGKHVLCEKPAALNEKQVSQMIEVCREENVVFAEAFMYRYHPKHRRVKEIIESGEIGEVRAIHANFTYNNCEDKDNVRFQKNMGGGSLYDVGVYPISAARMFLETEPEAVTVHALFSPEHDDVDMMASGLIEFPNKVALTFDCGMWACARAEFEILGTKGRIELPKVFGWENSDIPPQIIIHTDHVTREERVSVSNSFVLQAEAIADAILDGKPLPFAPEDAVNNIRVIEACLESAHKRERVQLTSKVPVF
ncbi:Gfo/Idh/MocA family oxidoreductase [Paenibacillus sp. Marseille-Q4541]|uniref:Gfo/Idh/MocA family protein n=1 Tax=Paenibacillus sp. Marseille-Q4541 TaxID=2831522 RepID=UPI001BACBB80|nr:Gfo/Idh/MocA family oxidoreductase [Paenibacillus sp. Marseille-Q4541]